MSFITHFYELALIYFNEWQQQVFRKEIIFIVDISESMNGVPIESVTNALSAATSELTLHDSFNIIAFNDEIYTFSPSLTRATQETVENAIQWMKQSFVAAGGTKFLKPLNEVRFSILTRRYELLVAWIHFLFILFARNPGQCYIILHFTFSTFHFLC